MEKLKSVDFVKYDEEPQAFLKVWKICPIFWMKIPLRATKQYFTFETNVEKKCWLRVRRGNAASYVGKKQF